MKFKEYRNLTNLNGWREKLIPLIVTILIAIPNIWYNISKNLHPGYMEH